MTTKELKHIVIDKVNDLNDDGLLKDLIRIIDNNAEDNEVCRLSVKHKTAINTAINQIKKGEYLTNEQSNKQIDKWLNK